jgi:hypothetical protein
MATPSGFDLIAIWGALTGTIALGIKLYETYSDRARLTASLGYDWPDFVENPQSDLGGDPGRMHLRLELTNGGRRAISVRSAGLTYIHEDLGRNDLFRLAFMKNRRRESRTLPPGDSWALTREADAVWRDLNNNGIGPTKVVGAYAETSTGEFKDWKLGDLGGGPKLDVTNELDTLFKDALHPFSGEPEVADFEIDEPTAQDSADQVTGMG